MIKKLSNRISTDRSQFATRIDDSGAVSEQPGTLEWENFDEFGKYACGLFSRLDCFSTGWFEATDRITSWLLVLRLAAISSSSIFRPPQSFVSANLSFSSISRLHQSL